MILAVPASIYLAAATAAQPALLTSVDYNPFARSTTVVHYSFEKSEDKDFDGAPDDWTRRKGLAFPIYANSTIDRKISQEGKQSL